MMTLREYRRILGKLGLPIVGATVFGVSRRQAQRYAAGTPIPAPVAMLMRLVAVGRVKLEELGKL